MRCLTPALKYGLSECYNAIAFCIFDSIFGSLPSARRRHAISNTELESWPSDAGASLVWLAYLRPGLAGAKDEVHARVGEDRLAELAHRQCKRRVLECLLHLSRTEGAKVAARLRAPAVALLRRQRGKLHPAIHQLLPEFLDHLQRLLLGAGDGGLLPRGWPPRVAVLHQQVAGADLHTRTAVRLQALQSGSGMALMERWHRHYATATGANFTLLYFYMPTTLQASLV
mmetsp:Transcript_10387/g.26733  ORF Transcript_10387/g.26733 Transcript_10387/m.26733 type:complete len:228 (-) Transcript_10387:100-783(-)